MKGLHWIDGAIARVSNGPVFGPLVLEPSELPGADSSRRRRPVLDIHRRVLYFSHALTNRLEKHS